MGLYKCDYLFSNVMKFIELNINYYYSILDVMKLNLMINNLIKLHNINFIIKY